MSLIQLRPTFRLAIGLDRDETIERLRTHLSENVRFSGRWRSKGRWADVYVPQAQRRPWSPHVSLRVDEGTDGGCTVFGRFAPDPEVWTFFMFLYVAACFGAVFGAVFGSVQWASAEAPWGLWIALASGATIGMIHLAGALGQRLGRRQMLDLKEELDGLLQGLPVIELDG